MSVFRVDGQQILPWTFETQMRLEKQLVKFWGGTKGTKKKEAVEEDGQETIESEEDFFFLTFKSVANSNQRSLTPCNLLDRKELILSDRAESRG